VQQSPRLNCTFHNSEHESQLELSFRAERNQLQAAELEDKAADQLTAPADESINERRDEEENGGKKGNEGLGYWTFSGSQDD